MSTFLYRLGRTAYGRPWLFIAGWVAVLAAVVGGMAINGVSVSSEMKIEGTEAQTVLDRVADELPEASGGQASVVFTVPVGERLDTPERLAVLSSTVGEVYELERVVNPLDAAPSTAEQGAPGTPQENAPGDAPAGSDPAQAAPYQPLMVSGTPVPGVLVSSDGRVALFQFQFTVASTSLTDDDVSSVLEVVERAEQGTGMTVLPSDSLEALEIPVGIGEVIGLAVAALVLVLTLGSLTAAGLPLITALVGVGIGVGGAYTLSNVVEMNSATPVLGLMVGLAVGIDYALFVVNRQRRLILDHGLNAHEAAGRAVGTAGSAVFFAGLTVLIALTALTVIGIAVLSTMALVAASTVALAVLIALSLLPALLGLVGERICSDKARARRRAKVQAESHGVADHWVRGVVRFRWPVIAGVAAILVVMAIPAASMNLGIPSGATANQDTAARQSYEAVSQSFGEGFNSPLLVTAEPTRAAGNVTPELTAKLIDELQDRDDIVLAAPVGVNEAGDLAVFSIIPTSGPDDESTSDLVTSLRKPDHPIARDNQVQLGVTGFTAIRIDMSDKIASVLPLYLGIIIVLSIHDPDAGLPLGGCSAQGHSRLPAQYPGHLRSHHCRLPVGLAQRPLRGRHRRPAHELYADHRDRHPLRTRHGLRGLLGLLDARSAHPRPSSPAERRPRVRPSQPGRRGSRHHHGRGVLRLHIQPRHHDQADRLCPRRRHPHRRLHRPADPRPRAHGRLRRASLVAAPVARPAAAGPRHRGRQAADHAQPTGRGHRPTRHRDPRLM